MLTEDQLRGVLQLPPHPYSESILFDGSRFYDLSHFEPLSVYDLIGTYGSNSAYQFQQNTDFVLNNGVLDFGSAAHVPVLGTNMRVDYSYSVLSEATVSTSMWIASTTVTQELASTFPYGSTSAAGVAYNDLATLGMLMVCAREACAALAASEVQNAVKYRRGALQMDETEKTKNWSALSKEWAAKYNKYLNMIRVSGKPSYLAIAAANACALVFPSDGDVVMPSDMVYGDYGGYGGIL